MRAEHDRGLTYMDNEIDDLVDPLCCGGCWSCRRLLEIAFLRGWLEQDPELSEPHASLQACPSSPTSPPASA